MSKGFLSRQVKYGIFWALFVAGMVMVILGPIIDKIMVDFDLNQTMAGFLSSSYAIGSIIGMLISSLLWPCSMPSLVLGILILIGSISLTIFGLSQNYSIAVASFLVAGFANGFLFTFSTNVVGDDVPIEKKATTLNYLYSVLGLGVVVGPFMSQLILNRTGDWRPIIYVQAFLMFIASVWMFICTASSPVYTVEKRTKESRGVKSRGTFSGELIFLLIAIHLYVCAEGALCVWIAKFFSDVHSLVNAAFVLTLLWIGITLGRLLQGRFLKECDYRTVMFMAGISTFALLGGALVKSMPIAVSLYFIVGLCFAGIYPSIVSFVSSMPTKNQSFIVSVTTSVGSLGAVTSPPIFGALAEQIGFRNTMAALSFVTLGVILALWVADRLKLKRINSREDETSLSC